MDLFEYLFKSFISLTLFYLVYISFLRRETYFRSNRYYLLSSIVFALLLPFVNIISFSSQLPQNFSSLVDAVTISGSDSKHITAPYLSVYSTIIVVYLAGVGLFFLRFIYQLIQLIWLVKEYEITYKYGIKIAFIDKEYSPFSFFKYVFINKALISENELDKIIAHEKVHAKQYHSFDLILFEVLRIIHWFNPLVWLYKYSLTEVHEYLADEGVLQDGYDKYNYQNMLLAESFGVRVNYLNNNFNQSLIKNRIMMMKKQNSTNLAKLKYLIALPVISLVLFAFSGGINPVNHTPQGIISSQNEDTTVFYIVEDMPIFRPDKNKTQEEGEMDLQKYVAKNVKYPSNSREEGVQGKIYIEFIVNTNGKVVNVKVARSSAEKPEKISKKMKKKSGKIKYVKCDATELESEALRVIRSLPDFSPGKQDGKPVQVMYTMPINFKLS